MRTLYLGLVTELDNNGEALARLEARRPATLASDDEVIASAVLFSAMGECDARALQGAAFPLLRARLELALIARVDDPSPYSPDKWQAVVGSLERASGTPPDQISLKRRLAGLFEAVGRSHGGDEYAKAFQEFAASEPSHSELAACFREVAKARNPLDPAIYRESVAAELNAATRALWKAGRWPRSINRHHPIRGMTSDLLTDAELAVIRAEAKRLAAYHQSFVRRQAPNKLDQDTLLEGLADIFLDFAKLDRGRHELPHSENSLFIQFVHAAVRPFFGSTEMSAKAIARRWKRLKDHAAKGWPQPEP